MSLSVLPMIFSNSFIGSGLIFRSLILFEFIVVYGFRKCSNFILLHVDIQFSQHHLLKRLSLPHSIFLPPLSKIRYPQVHGFVSWLFVLFCWSIFLCLCQYHTVLKTLALQYNLKSGMLIYPAPFFFLRTVLAIWGYFVFPYELCNFLFYFCEKCHWQFDRQCIVSVGCIWQYSHFHNINSSYTGTWDISPFVYVVFDFFHQCLEVFLPLQLFERVSEEQ